MKEKILLVDDEESIRLAFSEYLTRLGHSVVLAKDYDEALGALNDNEFALVYLDIILGGKSGIDILSEIKSKDSNIPVIMITGSPNIETAAEAVRLGAYDYISKPIRLETLERITNIALQHKTVVDDNIRYRSNIEAILRSINDAVISVDSDLNILEFNKAAETICGFKPSFKGKGFKEASNTCDGKCTSLVMKTIKENAQQKLERFSCQHDQGRVVTANSSPLLDQKGDPFGAVLIIKDETRLALLEHELKQRQSYHSIIGKNHKMQELYDLIESLSNYDSTVLISGESGTGKELVAESLHYSGSRSEKPLVKINCAALPENLLENELFGHVKGAFTGATSDKEGKFELADGGSIFLDEIGDISHHNQIRLLRVLQEKSFERVGSNTTVNVDVRIITATNTNLSELVNAGKFREDLFYRLNVVKIDLPPLRERIDDIPLLIEYFIEKFNMQFNKEIKGISSDALKVLTEYPWPGNIRQLSNTLESIFVWAKSDAITLEQIPDDIRSLESTVAVHAYNPSNEKESIVAALQRAGWNKAKAARHLGITRTTLYKKLLVYGISEKIL